MKLYAISDLHLATRDNRQALLAMPAFPGDWLILAGDIGEREELLEFALTILTRRFGQVFWVPGNHDLWTLPNEPGSLRGVERYQRLVSICRNHRVLTPEDSYIRWPPDPRYLIAPLFTLYDYSFRPAEIAADEAVAWAAETNVVCSDEFLLHPDPYDSRAAWCAARCAYTEQRLAALTPDVRPVLINHWPLRRDLVRLQRIPRFSIWCGTRRTEDWHTRFRAAAVVSGHLHIRAIDYRDGVRFDEVSFGYPKQWQRERGIAGYLRQILPLPADMPRDGGPFWQY